MTAPNFESMIRNFWKATPATLAARLTRTEPDSVRFQCPRHVDYLSDRIVAAVAGSGTKFIALSVPPQNGKSTLVSKWAPVWFLENWPYRKIILGGYSGDFAEQWGRATRDIIETYKEELTVRINPATTAAGEWQTTAGGGMVAVGVGGSATGRTADGLLIVDDPFKDSTEANSPTMREKVWDWFVNVMMTRRGPNTVVVVIHTRWHPGDVIGRIIQEMASNPEFPRFECINLPAVATGNDVLGRAPGEPLWPERYSLPWLRQQKALMGTYRWNALYQGQPTAPEGGYFKRLWMEAAKVKRAEVPPRDTMKLVRYWDLAGSVEGEKGNHDPDWTIGGLMGMVHGIAYILEVERFRRTPGQVEQAVAATAKRDGPRVKIRMQQDPGQAGKSQVIHYARHVVPGYDFRGKTTTLDKVSRSGPVNAAFERGDVKMVEAPWNEELIEEAASFPNGLHDDHIDFMSGAYDELTGHGIEWTEDTVKSAFSYNAASEKPNAFELIERRRREAIESRN